MQELDGNRSLELAARHFGSAKLFDQRRTQRLVESGRRILQHPEGSLPQKMGNAAALEGLYRLLEAPEVRHEKVLAPHGQHTRERMRQQKVVLLVHDTTELDYSHIAALQSQLGQIVSGRGRWGYLCHNSLALSPEGQVLGLAHQILHPRRRVPQGERRSHSRAHPQRESRLWLKACQSLGPAPAQGLWVDVCDRGADTFEFLAYELREHRHFVIRCAKNRSLFGEDHVGVDQIYQTLFAYVRDLPPLGQQAVALPAVRGPHPGREAKLTVKGTKKARPARIARVLVAAGPVSLKAPHAPRGEGSESHLELWALRVWEQEAPEGAEPLEWLLLTDLACASLEQVQEKIRWYECRPIVEEYHKAMKSGLGVEQLQLEKSQSLEPAIALLSVAAAVLLELRTLGRGPQAQTRAAQQILDPLEVQLLAQDQKVAAADLTVEQALLALACWGGHMGGRRRPAGWLTLWRGWTRLQERVQGVLAFQALATSRQRCDDS